MYILLAGLVAHFLEVGILDRRTCTVGVRNPNPGENGAVMPTLYLRVGLVPARWAGTGTYLARRMLDRVGLGWRPAPRRGAKVVLENIGLHRMVLHDRKPCFDRSSSTTLFVISGCRDHAGVSSGHKVQIPDGRGRVVQTQSRNRAKMVRRCAPCCELRTARHERLVFLARGTSGQLAASSNFNA